MEFYIRKNSALPILKMELINDGRYSYNKFYEIIQNSEITFSMKDSKNGNYCILNKEAFIGLKPDSTIEEYYIMYKFSPNETKKSGEYIGEFTFNTSEGKLITPITEDLIIIIR